MKHFFTARLKYKILAAILLVLMMMIAVPAGTAHADVGLVDAWPATPTQTADAGNPTAANFTVSAGTDRLLVVVVDCYDSNGSTGQTFSATYGGDALTQAVIQNSNRRQTWIGWRALGSSATSTTALLAVSITGDHTNATVWAAAYSGVDQTSPISATKSFYGMNETKPIFPIPALSVNAGGYGIYTWSSGRSHTSDNENYTESGESSITNWSSGVASKAFTTAGTTRPQVTFSLRNDASLSLIVLNPSPPITPPSIAKSFGTATISVDGTTTLTFVVTNPNTDTVLTGVAFTDNLPTGLVVATPNGLTGNCGSGTITATQATSTVSLSDATLAADSSCTFSINVTGKSLGVKDNVVTVDSSNGGTGNTAQASIAVAAPPEVLKYFDRRSIPLNGTATLFFDIYNLNNVPLSDIAFTVILPDGLAVDAATELICGGTLTITAPNSIVLTGGSLPPNDSCSFNLSVTGTSAGLKRIPDGDYITVVAPPTLSQSFNTSSIGTGTLTFTITNPNTDTVLTGVGFTDYLSGYLYITTPSRPQCGGFVENMVSGIEFTDGVIAANSSCSFSVNFIASYVGIEESMSSRITSTNGGTGNATHATIVIEKFRSSISTNLSATSIEIDNSVYDTASLSGTYGSASGTVTYIVYSDSSCKNDPQSAGTKFVNSGLVPNSDPITFHNAGTYYWQGAYSGDDNNEPAVSECTSEILTVGKAAPTLTTSLSTSNVLPGKPVYDTAALSSGSANAGGTVAYTVYTDDACTLGARSAGTKTVTNGSVPNSDALVFVSPGTYYWQAAYSGDANNEPAISDCSSEILTVRKLTPAVRTSIHDSNENEVTSVVSGATVHALAAVIGTPVFPVPTGTVSFALFPNDTCTGASSDAGAVSLTTGTAHPSTSQGPLAVGVYAFKALYNGDSIYEAAESACEALSVSDYEGLVIKELVASNWSFSTPLDHVAIGEIVTYETSFSVPSGSIENLKLTDTLDAGLAYVSCEGITGPTTLTCASISTYVRPLPDFSDQVNWARQIGFSFGTVNNPSGSAQDLTVRYRVVVLDSAGNLRDKTLNNSAVWSWNSTDPANPNIQAAQPVAVVVIEPSLAITKSISPTIINKGGTADVTIVISHTAESNQSAFDVEWSDPLPAGLTYVPGSLTFSGQLPTSSNDSSLPNLSATWNELTLTGAPATIAFKVTVDLNPGVSATNSTAVAWTSLPGNFSGPHTLNNLLSHERFYDPASPVEIYTESASSSITVASTTLPGTGFAPGRMTLLGKQPNDLAYANPGSLYLEIPALHKFLKIVGVPQSGNGWDVTWLGNQAGYLQGTAFPTWKGNSVITAHVYDANGKPGPFIDLSTMHWGDRIIIHAFGTKYIYEVRGVVRTTANDSSLLKHEESPWITLITCQGYNARTNSYTYRIGVRAVLIDSQPE